MLRVCVNWPVKLYVSVKFSVFRFFTIAILNWMLFCESFCMTLPRWMISFHRLSLLFKLSKGIQFSASRKPIVSDVALDCEYSYTIWDVCTFLSEFSLFHVRSNPQPPCPDVSYRRMRPLLLSCPALCFLIFPFTRILTDIAYLIYLVAKWWVLLHLFPSKMSAIPPISPKRSRRQHRLKPRNSSARPSLALNGISLRGNPSRNPALSRASKRHPLVLRHNGHLTQYGLAQCITPEWCPESKNTPLWPIILASLVQDSRLVSE